MATRNPSKEIDMEIRPLLKSSIPIFIAFSAAVLASCASVPTAEQLASANYGREISPQECVSIAEQVIANALKDPSSAQFRHENCIKGYWSSVPILGMPIEYGWFQQGEVNGKNSFGGYVGFAPYQVLIRDGRVVRYCMSDSEGLCMPVSP